MKNGSRIGSIVFFFFLIIVLIKVYGIYDSRDFNDFVRAEKNINISDFSRDNKITTCDYPSFKIYSDGFNDAMFFETVNVTPNTPYKVTCLVKTDNIQKLDSGNGGGAQISIEGTTERSKAISGTNDWTKLVLYFNSRNRTEVNIGFRLGGYDNEVTGTAWFSDITFEEGTNNNNNNTSTWNFACFIIKNLDANINVDGAIKNYKFNIDEKDISLIEEDMARFKNTCERFSEGRMKINYNMIQINQPLTSLSYDEENKYYVNPTDVEPLIDSYITNKEYDHIFIVVRMGDISKMEEIPVNDWIGLGAMDYHNIGFANIRLPNNQDSYIYRFDSRINQFPEEVFLHEFLHTLERNLTESGYDIPALHDYNKYGYESDGLYSLREWYRDYMQKKINYNGTQIGLDSVCYSMKPVHESDFQFSYKKDIVNEPKNIIEEIRAIIKHIINLITVVKENGIENIHL